ncbi:MAG TPA: O-antigen ligase family protein [Acidobacteriota bacterium]|nr:O-antigen ligase family protein [Acidobacteriota bacterium]
MPKPRAAGRQSGKITNNSAGAHGHKGTQPTRYLSRGIQILGCAALFLPLVVNEDFYYPYVFLKSILFRLVVQAMVLLYVLLAVTSPPHRPRFNKIIYALLAYFGIMLISSLPGISVSAWNSWWGDFTRMGGMITQLHLLAYFLVLTQTLKQERDWLVLFTASLFFGTIMGLTGLVQYLDLNFIFGSSLRGRIQGATGNPIFFGVQMMLNFFIAVWFLSRKDRDEIFPFIAKVWLLLLFALDAFLVIWDVAVPGRGPGILSAGLSLVPIASFALLLHSASVAWFFARRNVAFGAAFLSALGLYYLFWMNESQTRAAVVGLAASLAFFSVLYLWAGAGKRLRWTAASLFLILMSLPALVWLNRNSPWVRNQPTLSRLASVSFSEERVMAWKAGVLGILDRPILGWGPENYKYAFDLHFPPRILTYPEAGVWYDRAHSVIVGVGAASGLLGLGAYLTFYVLVFIFLLRQWRRTREVSHTLMIAALLAAYLFQNLFSFDTVNTNVIVFLLLAYVAFLFSGSKTGQSETPARDTRGTTNLRRGSLVIVGAAAILAVVFWWTVQKPGASNFRLNYAIALEKAIDARLKTARYVFRDSIIDLFQQAGAYRTTGKLEVWEEFANYASELVQVPDVPLDVRVRVARMALAKLEESIALDPNSARRYLYPSTFTNKIISAVEQSDPALARSLCERALVLLRKAESLSPTRPQIFIDRAEALMTLGRPQEAIPEMEVASALNPEIMERRTTLVALYVSAGRYDDAAREWQKLRASFPLTAADYDRLIRLYGSKKQFAAVVALFKEELEKSPNDPLLMARLASAYRDSGQMELARQTAMKAATLSPQVAAALQEFLNTLKTPKP